MNSQKTIVYATIIENISSFQELCSFFASYIKEYHKYLLDLILFDKRIYSKTSCLVTKKIMEHYLNMLLKKARRQQDIFELFVNKLITISWKEENIFYFFIQF